MAGAILTLASAFLACRRHANEPSALSTIFLGFGFVGEFPAEDVLLESRPHNASKAPNSWINGPQYVYHLVDSRSFEEIPTVVFSQRIKSSGGAVVYAPRDWRDMVIPNMGNPGWEIEFTIGRYRGHIRNRLDTKLYSQFARSPKMRSNTPDPRIDDYVLTLA